MSNHFIHFILTQFKEFKDLVSSAVEEFGKIGKHEPIRLISHLDCDGITSCSIIVKALSRENRRYSITITQHIDEQFIEQLAREDYKNVVFTDIGSGQFSIIAEKLSNKKIIILDHHELDRIWQAENIAHVNPHLAGLDGSREICGAGVSYLFAKGLNAENKDMAHIAVIGSIGDMQEDSGNFRTLNAEILQDAVTCRKMKVITGLRVFGSQTRPLHVVLAHHTEHLIPGITGSEWGAISLLQNIGINPKNGSQWIKLTDLSDEQLKTLITEIIILRMQEQKPEAVIGPVYILPDEKKDSSFRDAREFSTLLNACGRLGKASLGIGSCLNDKKSKEKAIRLMEDYRREIVNAMNWYKESENSESITKGARYVIINAEDNVRATIIGTLASIISKAHSTSLGTYLLSMARLGNGSTKVSLRIANKTKNVDLMPLITEITNSVGGKCGGHRDAAGAIIKTEKEKEFVENAKLILDKRCIEDQVV